MWLERCYFQNDYKTEQQEKIVLDQRNKRNATVAIPSVFQNSLYSQHFLQRLCMQALHTLNSDNLERLFLKINPTRDFCRVFHSGKAAIAWHHAKHINSCPPPETQQKSQYWEQSWVKTVFFERCIICIRYIYFYPALALIFKELKCPNLFNKTSSA